MARLLDTPGGIARAGVISAPTEVDVKSTRPSVLVRIFRIFYAVLCSVFVAGVLVQVFFAGMGAFGADWSWHLTFVHFLEPLPLLMTPAAFLGRLPWKLRLLPLALVFLVGVQYAFANATVPAAALHPVNGVMIFLISLFMARQAWAAVARRSKG